MLRIDGYNARPDVNGAGKKGFSDNADLAGVDATVLTPNWLNHVQEELCNLLEKNGVVLDAAKKDQLFQLLATYQDIDALAAAVQQKLNQEQQWRETADNQLRQDLNIEVQTRITALNQEQQSRENRDNDLQQQVSNERDARIYSDNLLNEKSDLKYDKAGGSVLGLILAEAGIITKGLMIKSFGINNPISTIIDNQASYTSIRMTDGTGNPDTNPLFKFDGRLQSNSSFLASPSIFASEVTSQRSLSTIYVNDSPRPRVINVTSNLNNGGTYIQGFISEFAGDFRLMAKGQINSNVSDGGCNITFVVPPNYFYKVEGSGRSFWSESF